MIRWNLVEIMRQHRISGIDLAGALGLSRNSISTYRRGYPRITKDDLDNLLNALNRLRRVDTPEIKIQDLIEYRRDE